MLALFILLTSVVPALAEEEAKAESKFGFKLTREEEVPSISSTAIFYEHEKTGAEIIWLKNEDPFKVFAACFRTEPQDATGSPHIIEHALLGGSRKYQSNDVFTDMNAISPNSFMNAMTYPDKTIFPIASRDTKDFANLTDLYLDSVFFPNIKEDKAILDQEGWHYEIFDKEAPIVYNGVVYNEMRGANSDPFRLLFSTICQSIFPETIYANNSGGDPDVIPDLTYEQFLEFYNTYYHPSNSTLYFYGDVDIDYFLEHIDKEYLSQFEKKEVDVKYVKQEPFATPSEIIVNYNIGVDEDPSNKTMLSYNIACGDSSNLLDAIVLGIVSEVLADTNSAPIKNTLLEKGIGQDSGSFWLSFNQNSFGIVALNAEADQMDEFVSVVDEALAEAAKDIDDDTLEAILNSYELDVREAASSDGLKGMDYLSMILGSHFYGNDALEGFNYDEIFSQLREGIKTGLYEKFVQDYLIDNPHSSRVILQPEPGMQDKKDAEVAKKLAAYKESLSEEELEALIEENKANEAKKGANVEITLPRLKVEEIDTSIEETIYSEKEVADSTMLFSDQPTNGIAYMDLQFDLSTVDVEKLPYAVLLSNLLGDLDTEKYTYGELETEMLRSTGGFGFEARNAEHLDTREMDARFSVNSYALMETLPELIELLEEITLKTKFEDIEWIGQQITQMRNNAETSLQSEGVNLALLRARAYFSPTFAYRDYLSGVSFLRFLQDMDEKFAKDPEAVIAELENTYKTIFNRQNLVIGISCEEKDYEEVEKQLSAYLEKVPNEKLENGKFDAKIDAKNEAFATSGDVNYVVVSGDFKEATDELSEIYPLVTNILDNKYLYTELRQKGGAYGAYSFTDNYGNFVAYTFRDPNAKKSVESIQKMGEYLSNLEISQEELDGLIVGYFKAYPTTAASVASDICYRHLNGLTDEKIIKQNEAVLAATPEDIRAFGETMSKMLEQNYYCVVGKASKVEEEKDFFEAVEYIVPIEEKAEAATHTIVEGDNIESVVFTYYTEEQLADQALVEQIITENMDIINPEDGSLEVGAEFKLPGVDPAALEGMDEEAAEEPAEEEKSEEAEEGAEEEAVEESESEEEPAA